MRRVLLTFFLFAASCTPAFTQNLPAVDPAHQATEQQVRQYFVLVNLKATLDTVMTQMIKAMQATSPAYVPASVFEDFRKTFTSYDMVSEMIPIYQKHLSREDMTGILAFYASDPGKHILATQAVMTQEAQQHFQEVGRRLGEQVGERHAAEVEAARKQYEQGIVDSHQANQTPK